jgi:hypothetical protein
MEITSLKSFRKFVTLTNVYALEVTQNRDNRLSKLYFIDCAGMFLN